MKHMGTKNITVAYGRYMIMGNHDYITIEIIKINIGTKLFLPLLFRNYGKKEW